MNLGRQAILTDYEQFSQSFSINEGPPEGITWKTQFKNKCLINCKILNKNTISPKKMITRLYCRIHGECFKIIKIEKMYADALTCLELGVGLG